MNKLMGFYELKNMQLPSIPWAEYTGNEPFSEQLLLHELDEFVLFCEVELESLTGRLLLLLYFLFFLFKSYHL